MNSIHVLDCTLRDGGYCNQWNFGAGNIRKILAGLDEANVDIIECGYLSDQVERNENSTRFCKMSEIAAVIPKNRKGKLYVCMINYGEYAIEAIPAYEPGLPEGIRVAFHKKHREEALEYCAALQAKGYKVFVQPMVSMSYSDEEFIDLVRKASEFEPYAFYIVDSFGVMKNKDLIRLFYMVEHNLTPKAAVGYHSHNNMQLAYANAQALVNIQTNRRLIIDSSIYGMGRGAGNLNTELFVEYLNDYYGGNYNLRPLLSVIDAVLNFFYQQKPWGYTLATYLSAAHGCHPNYAFYLDGKKTLTVECMDEIFAMIPAEKKNNFDAVFIEELYSRYLASGQAYEEHLGELKKKLGGASVLVVAPGRTSEAEKQRIRDYVNEAKPVVLSVNFKYEHVPVDYVFISNLRRYRRLQQTDLTNAIVTSNIPADGVYLKTSYSQLSNDTEAVKDNASLMLVRFLIDLGVSEIVLAGVDGYSYNAADNYGDSRMAFVMQNAVYEAMNKGLNKVLAEYAGEVPIRWLTTPQYVSL